MGSLRITGLTKTFNGKPPSVAVRELDLEIDEGELLVLLGPSGCGKTTTLRLVAGLEEPDCGQIAFGDKVVYDADEGVFVPTNRRDLGMVFQSYALWPHLTVRKNIRYPLKARGMKQAIKDGWVESAAKVVNCEELLERSPSQLSGGQQQRVAFARAIVSQPSMLLFDEPLSNLDAGLRDQLRAELHALHAKLGFTGLYVTHDQAEAFALGDRLAVMRHGEIEQIDTPSEVFTAPRTGYIAEFLGITNRLQLQPGEARLSASVSVMPADTLAVFPSEVSSIRVRANDVRLRDPAYLAKPGEIAVHAKVIDATYTGYKLDYKLDVPGEPSLRALTPTSEFYEPDAAVLAVMDRSDLLLYDHTDRLFRCVDR